jgi:ribonuclease HI
LAFSTLGFTCTALITGACVVRPGPAAIAGAARTDTASKAAEIVLNMVVSSNGIMELTGRMAGLFDRADDLNRRALNPF